MIAKKDGYFTQLLNNSDFFFPSICKVSRFLLPLSVFISHINWTQVHFILIL